MSLQIPKSSQNPFNPKSRKTSNLNRKRTGSLQFQHTQQENLQLPIIYEGDGALGQVVDIQLGLAIDSAKATLVVKRRLACEMVKCWQQAQDNIMNLPLTNGWGDEHKIFIKWKYIKARAAAYYYHGLILDEGNTEKSHCMAVAALQAADEYLKESKKACEAFNATVPISRLVIDRETRKPKGYGFCEYKDEETTLSARHNLQGYEINGRQLRVDFSENDKNRYKNKDQGRGPPSVGLVHTMMHDLV